MYYASCGIRNLDNVRKDIYFNLALKLIKRPPGLNVYSNYFKYKIALWQKKTVVLHFPVSLVFYTNKICNFKCSFCYNQDVLNKKKALESDLTLEQFKKIMENPFGKAALRIAFLGGEPFLNSNIFEFINYGHKKRKITNVVTNASQLKGSLLEDLVKSPIDVVGISLYDNNADDVARVVKRLNEARKLYWVQTVASAQNLNAIKQNIDFGLDIKCRNLIISNYNPYFDKKYENILTKDNRDYFQLEKSLRLSTENKMNIQWLNAIESGPRLKKSCKMPFSYAHVDNQGNIGSCCFRYPDANKFGNIYSDENWNTPETVKIRKNLITTDSEPIDECKDCENLVRDLYGV